MFALNCGRGKPLGCRLLRVMPSEMICRCLLVEQDNHIVLVDSGFGQADVRARWRRLGCIGTAMSLRLCIEETAYSQIQSLGFDPNNVKHIVLTHLDFDHAGGISDFPDARVHVLAAELQAARQRKTISERLRYRTKQFAECLNWVPYDQLQPNSWFGFDSIKLEVGCDPPMRLIYLPGHTRGHCGVAIKFDDSWLLHVGDCYYSRGELCNANDSLALRTFQKFIHVDYRRARQTMRQLQMIVERHAHQVQLLCSHDPNEKIGSFDLKEQRTTE